MDKNQKEQLRHEIYLEKLEESKSIKELPKKVTPSLILSTLTSLSNFKDYKIEKNELNELVEPLMSDINYLISEDFSNKLEKKLKLNYNTKTEDEIKNKVVEVVTNKRLFNLLSEVHNYELKYLELDYKEKTNEYKKTITKINSTRNIEDLPKIGVGNVNSRIAKDLYELFNKESLKVIYTGAISNALLDGKDFDDEIIRNAIEVLCKEKTMINSYNSMDLEEKVEYVTDLLSSDYELQYMVEEVIQRENRIKKIYKLDHEDIMDQIEDATRISEMPSNLSISRITSYLSGNSMIYPKGKVIQGGEFLNVAQLLLSGKKMSDVEIQNELKNITGKNYEENNEESYKLLKDKLSNLPKLDYYVEEVKVGMQRQQEFISRGSSNVNVYFIPNPKSPMDGGRFYNCYINRASNLNLEEVLPLDLEEIVPPNMDIDAIEWYVRKKADPTFKAAGGIILNKDESIGGVNIFRPNDGKVGITPEEKSKYEKLEELSKKLKEITDKSKKAKEEYMKAQAVIDEEISTIQDAMNVLIEDENEKVLKKQWKKEE